MCAKQHTKLSDGAKLREHSLIQMSLMGMNTDNTGTESDFIPFLMTFLHSWVAHKEERRAFLLGDVKHTSLVLVPDSGRYGSRNTLFMWLSLFWKLTSCLSRFEVISVRLYKCLALQIFLS